MAPEWEGIDVVGLGLGMGMGMEASYSTSSVSVAPLTTTPAYLYGSLPPTADASLHVDDLFASAATDAHFYAPTTTGPSTFSDFQGSFDLYIPQFEDAAELEWLSQFVEDSFSYQPGTSAIAPSCEAQPPRVEQSADGSAGRSKRSGTAAAWPPLLAANSPSSSSSSEFPPSKPKAAAGGANNGGRNGRGKKGGGGAGTEGWARRCTHCASEKTPQWRTGPLGPKTLCNACGVRYKSGRLVPEYRPAASPTFVLTQHSNSHRKVMELRRQKELLLLRHCQETDPSAAAPPLPELLLNDYGV